MNIKEHNGYYEVTHNNVTEKYNYQWAFEQSLSELVNEYEIYGGVISIGDNWGRCNVFLQIRSLVPDFNFVNANDVA